MQPSDTQAANAPALNVPASKVLSIFGAGKPTVFDPALVDRFYIVTDQFDSDDPVNDSLYRWGCLVKTWATNQNHLPGASPGDPFPARPTTGAELADVLTGLGITFNLPSRFTKVAFCETTQDTLAIRLPAKEAVLSKEQDFATGAIENADYQLPAFYPAFFGPLKPLPTDKDTRMYVHTLRVGEYSMNNCAG